MSSNRIRRNHALPAGNTLGLLLWAGFASVAGAQEAAPEAESGGAAVPEVVDTIPVASEEQAEAVEESTTEARGGIEEIIVTATKRTESVRDIPSTINVLTGDTLATQGVRELQDFADQVPGLQMQDVAVTGSRKIVIRGIAPDNTTNQTVGTVLGDVPLGDPIGSLTVIDPDPWDLQTVEVLKGPQGTLFGASSLAGLIRYVPKSPELETWEAKGFAEWMSVKEGDAAPTFGAALNVPVGSELAFRLSGVREHRPGVIDIDNPSRQEKDADDARKWSGRAMARWEPSERLTLNAWYMAQERRADESFFVTNFDADYTRYDAPGESPTKRTFDLGTVDARYRFDWATLVSLTGYQDKTNRFNVESSYVLAKQLGLAGISVGRARRDVEAQGLMQEFRLVSPDEGPWTWQGGVFYSDFDADVYSDIFVTEPSVVAPLLALVPEELQDIFYTENGVSLGSALLSPVKAREMALFGEVTRAIGPVNVTLGGRLYRTEVEGTSRTAGLLPFISNGQPETVEDLDVKGEGFSPKVALAWEASDDVRVYGGVSRGFQYGGVNAIAIPSPSSDAPKTYDSSALWAYEAGIRTDWLDDRLHADLTVFYQDWSDAQVSQIAPPAEAYIDNVGDVEVKGVEASVQYLLPIEGLSLDVNGSYLDSETVAEFTDSEGNEIPKGTDMPNAPHFQAAATLSYARVFGDAWGTHTSLQYTHAARSWGNIEHAGKIDERNLFNLTFTLTRSDWAFAPSLGLVVNNLTDERKIVSATETEEALSDPARALENFPVGYTRPRTVILRLSAEFE
ncbi:MAG TPA: TonB-dependent receptor [Nevskiaceae bacterium]|nr:TonB-dependent receptor [Nevskiaceae bacterium]